MKPVSRLHCISAIETILKRKMSIAERDLFLMHLKAPEEFYFKLAMHVHSLEDKQK